MGGAKIAVTPAGSPVTLRVRGPENPPVTDVAIGTSTLPLRTSDAVVVMPGERLLDGLKVDTQELVKQDQGKQEPVTK